MNLPTRLVNIEIKPGSTNKVELYLNLWYPITNKFFTKGVY